MMMLPTMMMLAAVLRDGTLSTWGSGEIPFGLPQALLMIGLVVLLSLLIRVVVWRIRRTPRSRSK